MKMHILSGGRLLMAKQTYIAEAGRDEKIELPVSCVLLRHPQANVLFDTGCHPDLATDPEARLGPLAKHLVPIMPAGDHVLSSLQAIGLAPDDIDVVVCSHLHTDHCGCNQFFRKATIVVHQLELQAARRADASSRGYIGADWDHPQRFQVIAGQIDLMGDDRINLIPLPGHSPGLIGALVKLHRDVEFLLPSDAVSLRENLDRNTVPRNTWDTQQFLASFGEVRKLEAAGVTVICSHDPQEWVTLRTGEEFYA